MVEERVYHGVARKHIRPATYARRTLSPRQRSHPATGTLKLNTSGYSWATTLFNLQLTDHVLETKTGSHRPVLLVPPRGQAASAPSPRALVRAGVRHRGLRVARPGGLARGGSGTIGWVPSIRCTRTATERRDTSGLFVA